MLRLVVTVPAVAAFLFILQVQRYLSAIVEPHTTKRYIHPDTFVKAFPNQTVLDGTTSFEELQDVVNLDIPVPTNLNIAFMGDSLTRFQYLDLVYFLSHGGRWVQRDDSPNLVTKGSNWNAFFKFTNQVLKPYEECDCFRLQGTRNIPRSIENRYFYEKKRNNRVAFLNKFGDIPFKTQWNARNVFDSHPPLKFRKPKYIYQGDWVDSIKNFVCKMRPKPSILIFNTGLHNHSELMDPRTQKEVVEVLRACRITSMYKTTTSRAMEVYEQQLCNQTDLCYDISWTGPLVSKEHYGDRDHFVEPIYSMLNVHLLSMLATLSNSEVSSAG